jgi:hypothetical protein
MATLKSREEKDISSYQHFFADDQEILTMMMIIIPLVSARKHFPKPAMSKVRSFDDLYGFGPFLSE